MNAITFFALFAVTTATALLVAAAGIAFVLWAGATVVSRLLRTRGANGVTSRELGFVHGDDRAWAGGSGEQRRTDASDPGASRQMARVLPQH